MTLCGSCMSDDFVFVSRVGPRLPRVAFVAASLRARICLLIAFAVAAVHLNGKCEKRGWNGYTSNNDVCVLAMHDSCHHAFD